MATTEQRLKEYEKLYKQAQTYDPNKFQGDFQKAYGEATNYNSDLINQQAQSLGELQAVAPTLRQQYVDQGIQDPVKQMALIAQARQAPITNWATAGGLLEARGNKYSDILAKALGSYQTSAQQANTAAENAWRLYQDAVQQSQFNKTNAPGGLSIKDILDLVNNNKTPEITPQQRVMNAINQVVQLRQTSNIENNMNQYFNEIMNQAKSLGLNLNSEALWQKLGNKAAYAGPQLLFR